MYGLCFYGWMLYPALALGALQNITEPCLQAIMATFVSVNRQGSLQVLQHCRTSALLCLLQKYHYDTTLYAVEHVLRVDIQYVYLVVCALWSHVLSSAMYAQMEARGVVLSFLVVVGTQPLRIVGFVSEEDIVILLTC